jgi:hypothetical protein
MVHRRYISKEFFAYNRAGSTLGERNATKQRVLVRLETNTLILP